MKPVPFPESNVIFAADQPQYQPLPAFRRPDTGEVITVWDLSDEDLDKIQRTGRIYLSQLTFNQPLQPIMVSVDKPEVLKKVEKKEPEKEI